MSKFEVRHDTGYGIISRGVMRTKGLSIEAKGIYAYLASFAGNTSKAFPSTSLMADELEISRNRLFKYLKELKEKGLVTIEKERDSGGVFTKNIYYLHNISPCLQNLDMDNLYMDNLDMGNEDTNSNNINSNNINSNNKRESPSKKEKEEGLTKQGIEYIKRYWNMVADKAGVPKVIAINNQSSRHTSLNARYKEIGINQIINAIDEILKSKFLQGNNSKNWTITFDWLINKNNIIKVLEGNYRDKTPSTNTGLVNEDYKTATEEEKATDEKGNLISF